MDNKRITERICSETRELYIRRLAVRKLVALANKLAIAEDSQAKLIAYIIDAVADDILFESADIYTAICRQEIKQLLAEENSGGKKGDGFRDTR